MDVLIFQPTGGADYFADGGIVKSRAVFESHIEGQGAGEFALI